MEQRNVYPSILQAVGLLVALVLLALLFSVPLAAAGMALDLPLTQHPAALAVVNAAATGLVLLWGLRRTGAPAGEVLPLRPVPALLFVPMTLTILGTSVVLSELDNLFRRFVPAPPELLEFFQQLSGGETSLWGSALALVIVAPLTEELLFRGLILRGFLQRYPVGDAVLGSAVLFAIVHLNPWQFAGATALGALLGWWYVQTRSLVPCIFGHALNNALPIVLVAILGVEIPGYTSAPAQAVHLQPLWFDLLGVLLLGTGITGSYMLFRRQQRLPPD